LIREETECCWGWVSVCLLFVDVCWLNKLIWILDLIMQIRNSDTQKNDFILSAVEKD
jgi:hypothetical protein